MIVGIGIDVVSVERIRVALENPRFVQKILTPREQLLSLAVEQVAGRWAAKEALAKAIPTLRAWHAVEIINDELGKPVVHFANQIPQGFDHVSIHLSISHEHNFAAACVIVESRQ